MHVAYHNGKWISSDEVRIRWDDRGFRFGNAVFDSPRTYGGSIFKLGRHVNRLYASLDYIRLDPGLDRAQFAAITEEAVQRNAGRLKKDGDFQIYMFVTSGPGRFATEAGPPSVGVVVYPVPFWRMAPFFETGVHGVVARTRSYGSGMLEPKLKHQSRLNFEIAELEASDVEPGAFAILLDAEGNITEGTFNAIFAVTDGVLRTPPDDSILQSVSRETVMELAERLGIPCSEEPMQPYDHVHGR